MLANPSLTKITEEFKEKFKKEIKKTDKKVFGTLFHVNRSLIRDIAIFLHDKGGNLTNILISDLGEKFELIYSYFFKLLKTNKYIFISTEVHKKAQIDSIELVFPQSKFVEDELSKRYGINFSRFTEEVEELFVAPKTLIPDGSELNITPLGIYNKIHLDNDYFYIQVENGKIIAISEKTGWLYRGITPLLTHKNLFEENLRITKKINYPISYHHNLAYIMAIEQLLKVNINDRVKYLRTLLCEFERFENHLLWFANLLFLLGYKRRYFSLLKRREEIKNVYRKYLNCTHLDELNSIGSIRDISQENLRTLKAIIENIFPLIYDGLYKIINKKYIRDQCQGIGILEKKEAWDAGVTGPCLRSSGINYDIRSDNPYLSYLKRDILKTWNVVTSNEGDVYGRTNTRLWEMKDSYNIIYKIITVLIEDNTKIKARDFSKTQIAANENVLIQLESPQGELLYYINSADRPGKKVLGSVYIATPSLKNYLALNNYLLKNNKESDFALIVHSMDLNFNDIDL